MLVLDQLTKLLVRRDLRPGESDGVLPGLDLVHVRNPGVAFGLFPGGGVILLIVTAAALVALLAYYVRHPERRGLWLPTALLLGGALGNLVDRIREGVVTDFVKLPLWPAFNVADMAITVGVLALLWVLEGPGTRRRA